MAGSTAEPESYEYDPVGNRTVSHLSLTHLIDDANRLTEDDQHCYGYDLNGNLETRTGKVSGACTGAVTTYTYDAQNQLTAIAFPDATTAAYAYDALGRRIRKDVDGTVAAYVYDGPDIYLEFDGAGLLLARYGHGQRTDQPLAMARDLDLSGTFDPGESFYYHADHQGSVIFLTDEAGFVANEYRYDAYGRPITLIETVENPYLYTAREFDAESGLYHYRARAYDPATGRFLQEDPLGFGAGDLNLYRYVANNPINFSDPSGLIGGLCRYVHSGDVVVPDMFDPFCTCLGGGGGFGGGRSSGGGKSGTGASAKSGAGASSTNTSPVAGPRVGPQAPIKGNAQVTRKGGKETTHASTSERIANQEATRPDVESVHLNQTIRKITGNEIDSRKQPDVAAVRKDGQVDTTEVLSPGQTRDRQTQKYSNALGDKAGTTRAVDPD